jgi:hypothetical protein
MIISHKHKFIFFKTRKTAGSSIQVTLANHCGENDIITGQYRLGVDDDSQSSGLNMDKFYTNHPHPILSQTKKFLGDKIWNSYFKFAIVRNPWDLVVSRYYWEIKGKLGIDNCSIEGFREWVKSGNLPSHDLLYPYLINDINDNFIDLDFVGYYENLDKDLEYICNKLNIPGLKLPSLKSGFRDKIQYTEHYNEETQQIIKDFYKKDIDLLGYTFNNKNIVSKRNPVIIPSMFTEENDNINGPTVIKVPKWVQNPLGKYYLYFSNHTGTNIKLAYSNNIEGPWSLYSQGSLSLKEASCEGHVASPDILIDNDKQEIVMYYHGDTEEGQKTFYAVSKNGINFKSEPNPQGSFYFRVFKYLNDYYAIAKNQNKDAIIYKSKTGKNDFKPIFNILPNSRHTSVLIENDYLYIFYTNIGEAPEQIYYCKIKLDKDINNWEVEEVSSILKPTFKFEGANTPLNKSLPGSSTIRWKRPVNEVRDPFIFKDLDRLYIFYTVEGELGIGLAEIKNLR